MQREFWLNLAITCALTWTAHAQDPGVGAAPVARGQVNQQQASTTSAAGSAAAAATAGQT